MKLRRTRIPLAERDRRIRAAELEAYASFGAYPTERTLTCTTAKGPAAVRVMTFEPTAVGPPVVLLHGIGSVSVLAAPLLPYLSGRPVHVVDWPGHGLSATAVLAPGTTFRAHAVDVLGAVLDELCLAEADVVGHSLGGQIGLYAALDIGERIRRLVLLGAPGAAFARTKPLWFMKILAVPRLGAAVLAAPLSDRMFRSNTERALGRSALDELPSGLVEAAFLLAGRTTNAPSVASFFRSLIRRASVRPGVRLGTTELDRVTQPTMIVWGDDDAFLTPTSGAGSIAAIRDVHLVRVPGAGHAPWLQAPSIVGRAIAHHLDFDKDRRPPSQSTIRSAPPNRPFTTVQRGAT